MGYFEKKRVVITGAGGIFGSWIAKAFAEQGASLWLLSRHQDKLEQLVSTLPPGVEVVAEPINLLETNEIAAFAERLRQKWGYAHFLVNNAGIYPSEMLLDMSRENWEKVLSLNLTAPFEMTKALSKLMIDNGIQGAVVNIISRSAWIPRVSAGHYAVSKAGLEMLTRAYAMELAQYKIRVNAVSPGLAPGSQGSQLSEEYIAAISKSIPLARTSGPDDAPQAVLFLCSEKASFITGASIAVDGGSSAGDFRLPKGNDKRPQL